MFDSLAARTAIIMVALAMAAPVSASPNRDWEMISNGLVDQVRSQRTIPYPLTERQRHYRVPAVSVAIIRDGRVESVRSWGRLGDARSMPANQHTLFLAASMTKVMTALAALRLVDRGHLSLDEDVNGRLSSWKIPFAPGVPAQPVTLRQLLSHSAGVTEYGDLGYAAGQQRGSLIDLLMGRRPDVMPPIQIEHSPGEAMRYSNPGYVIIQKLIEDVSNESFAAFARREVLDRLGMRDSYLEQPLTARTANVAQGFSGGFPVSDDARTTTELGSGGLWSTPSDMAKLLIAIQDAYAGKPRAILSQPLAQEMLKSQSGGWGLGVGVEGSESDLRFGHTGAYAGFECLMTAYARRGDGIVVMTNAEGGQQLGGEIVRAAAARYNWGAYGARNVREVEVEPSRVRALTGHYVGPASRAWVTWRGNYGWLLSDRGGWSRLIWTSPTRATSASNGIELSIPPVEPGQSRELTMLQAGQTVTLSRRPYLPVELPIFVRGSMNAWSTDLPLRRIGDRYVAEIELPVGRQQFKIASADWDAVDLGVAADAPTSDQFGVVDLEPLGSAITLNVVRPGRYRLELNASNETQPVLRVTPIG